MFRAKALRREISNQITSFPTKCLRSKRRNSPCIFQVVVSLSIRSFLRSYMHARNDVAHIKLLYVYSQFKKGCPLQTLNSKP
jgi:hypothetical protein